MNSIWNIKLRVFCLVFAAHSFFNVSLASSIQFAVDASLNQQQLNTAQEVIMTLSQAASVNESIGLLVYDDVFQRSVPMAAANEAQKAKVFDTLQQISPSDSSNLAVGIEKGTSELAEANDGYLVVLGHSHVTVTDPTKHRTYNDWLELVLLPDAEKNGISVLLAAPIAPDASINFQTSVTEFVPWSDVTSIINSLSTALPASLVNRIGEPVRFDNLPEPVITPSELPISPEEELAPSLASDAITSDSITSDATTSDIKSQESNLAAVNQSTNEVKADVEEGILSRMEFMLIGITSLFLLAIVAVAFLVMRFMKRSKSDASAKTSSARNPFPAPYPDIDYEASSRQPQTAPPSNHSQAASIQTVRQTLYEDESEWADLDTDAEEQDWADLDPDATLKNPLAQDLDDDRTIRRSSPTIKRMEMSSEADVLDDLDEIRALTKQRQKSLI
ncbi:MAG: hypothetical protein AB8B87_22015 [Granulosicoccus sp.]